jgi:hypothetical protein
MPSCLAFASIASRAARRFCIRCGGDKGFTESRALRIDDGDKGFTESRALRMADGDMGFTESRAIRIADRDMPGGERSEAAAGEKGMVSSGVIPNRHRFPNEADVAHSVPEDELSSSPEALPKPTSVVSSSSCSVDGSKAISAGGLLTSQTVIEISVSMDPTEVRESVICTCASAR